MGGGPSCQLTCGDSVGDDLASLMSYNGAYSLTGMTGNWHQIFALDNSGSGASSTYTEKYTVGYSKTLSTTEVSKWSVGLSAKIEDITFSAGYENSLTKYSEETWSTSEERDLSITVPAHAQVDYEQRTLVSSFQMNDFWIQGTGNSAGYSFHFQPDGNGFIVHDNLNNYCGSCHYNSGDIVTPKLGFNTNCYTTSLDPTARNNWCPEPTKGEGTKQFFSSESSMGLLRMIKIEVPGDDCDACSICQKQLEDAHTRSIFTDVGDETDRNYLEACLDTIICTNVTSTTTAEPCKLTITESQGVINEVDDSNGKHNTFLVICLIFSTSVAIGSFACAVHQYQSRKKEANYLLMNDKL